MCCLRRRCGACNACRDAGNARPGAFAYVGACSWLRASEFTAHARVLMWHVCACYFVRHADRVIKHKVFCVCIFGPCFLYALVYFVAGATCWSGFRDKQAPPCLFFATSCDFACTHARAHTGLQSRVTLFHGKRVKECYTSDSARASATNALVGPDTHCCGIASKPNHDTILPRLRTPMHTACSTAATVLPFTALLPPV